MLQLSQKYFVHLWMAHLKVLNSFMYFKMYFPLELFHFKWVTSNFWT